MRPGRLVQPVAWSEWSSVSGAFGTQGLVQLAQLLVDLVSCLPQRLQEVTIIVQNDVSFRVFVPGPALEQDHNLN